MNSNQKLISFDLKAEMGFFKKPDINDGIYLTYNMLHKPALLGILGAIVGLKGHEKEGVLPEYYCKLRDLKVAVKPLESDNGNYTKEVITYNNGTGFASNEAGGNLIVKEQTLLKPSYRCYLLLNTNDETEKRLYENIMSYRAEYIPYMGKNEFGAWWVNPTVFSEFKDFHFNRDFKISSLFRKNDAVSKYIVKSSLSLFAKRDEKPAFIYFEKLPVGFNEELFQYDYADFVYSNILFSKELTVDDSTSFFDIGDSQIIQMI